MFEMSVSMSALTFGSLLVFVSYVYQRWLVGRRLRALAEANGCHPITKYPHSDKLWGADLVRERVAAAKDGKLLHLYMEHFSKYGKTWQENHSGTKVINTMEWRNIQHVSATGFDDFVKPSNALMGIFLGDAIFSQDGHAWRHSRSLVKPIFSRAEISDLDLLGSHLERLLGIIPRNGSAIDLQIPINEMFMDTAAEFLFGRDISSEHAQDKAAYNEFDQAFQTALVGLGKRRIMGIFHRLYDLWDPSWRRACDKVHAYIDIQVKRVLKQTTEKSVDFATESKRPRYVFLYELAKQIRDPIKLRFHVLNVWIPSRDTTAMLLNSTLFHLARNPRIWMRLREESLSFKDQELTLDRLKSMQFFKHVIFETLRLQGPSTRVVRRAARDVILPLGGGPHGNDPILVQKGTLISMNLWGLHHDKDLWGEDVNKFRPDRWTEKRTQGEFAPFLGGPRTCPAQQQVMTQTTYVLVWLTREFSKMESRDPVNEYLEQWRLLPESRNGVKVAFFP